MIDTIAQSLIRGRLLAAATGVSAAGVSLTTAMTDTANALTALGTAILALISVIASLHSKVRELRRSMTPEDVVRAVIDEHRRSEE